MKRLARYLTALALFLPVALAGQGVGEVGLPLGTMATPVEIERLSGEPVDLGDFVGKRPVILEFWATWCENCEALQPQMNAAFAKYGDRMEFVIIAVAVGQSKRAVRRHADRHELAFDFMWDTRGRATRAFQAPTTSYIVVLDEEGKVTYTGVGRDQNVEAAVLTALEETD